MDLTAAHQQYEVQNGFSSEHAEFMFLEAQRIYTAQRKAFHKANPEVRDIDVLLLEDEHVLNWIKSHPDNRVKAADALEAGLERVLTREAECDAEDADYDTIMEAL